MNTPLTKNEVFGKSTIKQGIGGDLLLAFQISENLSIAIGRGSSIEEAKTNAWNTWPLWLDQVRKAVAQ